ncbi:Uncharacterised protein [Mycobacterium tuberculosis]|nr:Uncharacterised protein [Mycobacterium tuberculosis]
MSACSSLDSTSFGDSGSPRNSITMGSLNASSGCVTSWPCVASRINPFLSLLFARRS